MLFAKAESLLRSGRDIFLLLKVIVEQAAGLAVHLDRSWELAEAGVDVARQHLPEHQEDEDAGHGQNHRRCPLFQQCLLFGCFHSVGDRGGDAWITHRPFLSKS